MRARSLVFKGFASLSLIAAIGCAASIMKVPPAALSNPAWPIVGYSDDSVREPDITVAGHAVHQLVRIRRPLKSTYPNGYPPSSPPGYRFELQSESGSALFAECTEKVDPKALWLLRYGEGAVHLDCVCFDAQKQKRVELALIDGKGKLLLSNATRFEVTPIHQTAAGETERAALGYALAGSAGTGALERTGHGRAWPPPGLDAASESDLRCAYAALLLYRPEP